MLFHLPKQFALLQGNEATCQNEQQQKQAFRSHIPSELNRNKAPYLAFVPPSLAFFAVRGGTTHSYNITDPSKCLGHTGKNRLRLISHSKISNNSTAAK